MLENHFKATGVPYLRIDGTVSYQERLRILGHFNSSDAPIPLMSIQTGVVGQIPCWCEECVECRANAFA